MSKAIGIIMAILLVIFLALLPIILYFKPGELAKPTLSASSSCVAGDSTGVSFDDSQSSDNHNQTTIDEDGANTANNTAQGGNNQSGTSYFKDLDAYATNYIALNLGWAKANGIKKGDLATLTYNGKTVNAMYGDNHSSTSTTVHSEISYAAAVALAGTSAGTKANPNSLKGVHTTIFPNTGQYLNGSVAQSQIDTIATSKITCTSSSPTVASGNKGANGVPIYLQTDPRWANMPPGNNTIKGRGCAITSFAMILSYYGKNVDPAKADQLATDGGYISGASVFGRYFTDVSARYGLTSTDLYTSKGGHPSADIWNKVTTYLENKQPIMIGGYQGAPISAGPQHYIVLTGYNASSGEVSLNDPMAHGGMSTRTMPLSTFQQDRLIVKIRYIGH